MKRVAITGIGVVSPLGNTPDALVSALTLGISGIRRLEGPHHDRLATRVAATCSFDGTAHFPPPKLRMLDRASQFALVATNAALQDSSLCIGDEDKLRTGVSIGTGMGGSPTTDEAYRMLYAADADRLPPFTVLLAMNNAPSAWIAIEHGISGPSLTYSTACSSSTVAIGEAARRIKSGEADLMIAGGAEAPLSLGPMMAWDALRTLATEDPADSAASCKPFSKNRSGMVLGEGAAVLILEEWERAHARGARIYGELTGYGLSTDAAHLTRPTVEGQARAMQLALDCADMAADEIGYLNAHGTGTVANDATETQAIKRVFGSCAMALPVSSTKSTHGHLLGAAGALEFAIALLAMRHQTLPPTMHLNVPDPDCDLDYIPNEARNVGAINAVMSSSFAFGGTNAVLIARCQGSHNDH